jgi:hypothetical protein
MSWQFQVLTDRSGPGARALALEIDPRFQRVSLAWRIMGLGSAEVGSRALFRSFMAVEQPDLDAASAWLQGPTAAALLDQVIGGYQGSMTWSCDFVATWTPQAWAAAQALAAGVEAVI